MRVRRWCDNCHDFKPQSYNYESDSWICGYCPTSALTTSEAISVQQPEVRRDDSQLLARLVWDERFAEAKIVAKKLLNHRRD